MRQFLRKGILVGSVLLAVAGCRDIRPNPFAPVVAQPKTPAQRNHTPFYPALRCMDDLLLEAGSPNVLLSSNQIPDRTKKVYVDARSMIITALNHMTRRSKAFTFVEQGIHARTAGDTLRLEKDNQRGAAPPRPMLYFSGAISQVDAGVQGAGIDVTADFGAAGEGGLETAGASSSFSSSIVTLDLHLVRYPSRIVVPGSAISNSMVVSKKNWSSGFSGVISQRTLGLEFGVESVESQGQAVRSLIELGLIEMLGVYAEVPFWECLSSPDVNRAYRSAQDEVSHITGDKPERLEQAQSFLRLLGYTHVNATGQMDAHTRDALALFQARAGLLANGVLDFDTFRALEKEAAALNRSARETAEPPALEEDGFQSLGRFTKGVF